MDKNTRIKIAGKLLRLAEEIVRGSSIKKSSLEDEIRKALSNENIYKSIFTPVAEYYFSSDVDVDVLDIKFHVLKKGIKASCIATIKVDVLRTDVVLDEEDLRIFVEDMWEKYELWEKTGIDIMESLQNVVKKFGVSVGDVSFYAKEFGDNSVTFELVIGISLYHVPEEEWD